MAKYSIDKSWLTKEDLGSLSWAVEFQTSETVTGKEYLGENPKSEPTTADVFRNCLKQSFEIPVVYDPLSSLTTGARLGDAHPLAHLFGKYNNEPLWDDLMEAIRQHRARVNEEEELEWQEHEKQEGQ